MSLMGAPTNVPPKSSALGGSGATGGSSAAAAVAAAQSAITPPASHVEMLRAAAQAPSTSANDKESRWYFTADAIVNSPSRRDGIPNDQELNMRQKAAYLIQDMGQRLRVSQLCINTAIVYMHRFYMFHSFQMFHRTGMAAASLFLAAKVEEQPRKVESIIQMMFASQSMKYPEVGSPLFQEQAMDLVFNENVLLQTVGFDVAVDHPHTHVVKTCHLVKACKDLAQTSYFLASNSLHLTTMCLQYRPTVVACFCIYLACKWSRWEIPQSTEGKFWFNYVDKTVTLEILEQLTKEFIVIYDQSPSRLKKQLNNCKGLGLNSKSPAPHGSSLTQMQRHHQPQSSASASAALAMVSPATAHQHPQHPGIAAHQRSSTVHHHGGKLPIPSTSASVISNDHQRASFSSAQMLAKPSSTAGSVSSASLLGGMASTSSSSRYPPQQNQRSDHRQPLHSEPQFSAPHRPGTGGSSGSSTTSALPQIQSSSSHQPPPEYSGSSNKSRSNQPTTGQSSHQQYPNPNQPGSSATSAAETSRPMMHHTTQPKQRIARVPTPPKYSETKSTTSALSANNSSITSASASLTSFTNVAAPSKNQHSSQKPSHTLASKSSNYPPQQPPNYSQSILSRTNENSNNNSAPHHSQSNNHQTTTSNSNTSYSRTSGPNPINAAPVSAATGAEGLLAIMMDTTDSNRVKPIKGARVTSLFNSDSSLSPGQTAKAISNRSADNKQAEVNNAYKSQAAFNTAIKTSSASASMPLSSTSKPQRSVAVDFPNAAYHQQQIAAAYGMTRTTSSYAPLHQQQPQSAPHRPVKQETSNISPNKRAHSDVVDSQSSGDYQRDNKYRRVDTTATSSHQPSAGATDQFTVSALLKANNSFNGAGIETNPALVSSLLKASLSSNDNNKYSVSNLLGGQSVTSMSNGGFEPSMMSLDSMLDSQPPLNLLATDMLSSSTLSSNHPNLLGQQQLEMADNTPNLSNNIVSSFVPAGTSAATNNTDNADVTNESNDSSEHEQEHRHKSKKKKEKGKHKDRSKDREERKKHKKDKDRHRDRSEGDHHHHHRSSMDVDPESQLQTHNPIKIKIPKTAVQQDASSAAPTPSSGFKITFAKDRGGSSSSSADQLTSASSSLKIKISKDVIENYSSSGTGGGGSSSGASGKRRDRDHKTSSSSSSSTVAGGSGGHHHGSKSAARYAH